MVCDISFGVKFNHSCYNCEQNHITKWRCRKKSKLFACCHKNQKNVCCLYDQCIKLKNNCNYFMRTMNNLDASLVVSGFGDPTGKCAAPHISVHLNLFCITISKIIVYGQTVVSQQFYFCAWFCWLLFNLWMVCYYTAIHNNDCLKNFFAENMPSGGLLLRAGQIFLAKKNFKETHAKYYFYAVFER